MSDPHATSVGGNSETIAICAEPVGTILFFFAPDCGGVIVSRHIAAALLAGNRVECSLLGETDLDILRLCAIAQEVLPDAFSVIRGEDGLRVMSGREEIVIVTKTQVFRNDEPWIRCAHDDSRGCVSELSRFYRLRPGDRGPEGARTRVIPVSSI